VVSAWAFDDGFPHKNLRVRILVRDVHGGLVHKSRMERTFIRDDVLEEFLDDKEPVLGLHGYRYQLPRYVVERMKRKTMEIEMVVYGDGLPSSAGAQYSLRVEKGLKPHQATLNRGKPGRLVYAD
jgi:hypothetical protein